MPNNTAHAVGITKLNNPADDVGRIMANNPAHAVGITMPGCYCKILGFVCVVIAVRLDGKNSLFFMLPLRNVKNKEITQTSY